MQRALSRSFAGNSNVLRSTTPLDDDQIRRVAPSIFASEAHASRSERYAYIPTIDVLNGLRKEGFEPFMVVQSKSRIPGKSEFTKHMLRLRHRGQIGDKRANEIILINSHDGTSSYQMLAGVLEFVCQNGMVAGDIIEDLRIGHRGQVQDNVIEGAYTVLDGFELVDHHRECMMETRLNKDEMNVFAQAALQLRYGEPDQETGIITQAPIQASQLLKIRRFEDDRNDLWATFNVVQENMIKGGLPGRTANNRRTRTRPVQGIDRDIKLNQALWVLAEGMRQLKSQAA